MREQEVTEFAGKLRNLEQSLLELKKQAPKDFEVPVLEKKVKQFKEDKAMFVQILGQELQVFLPQP